MKNLKKTIHHYILTSEYGIVEFHVMSDYTILAVTGGHFFNEKSAVHLLSLSFKANEEFITEVMDCFSELNKIGKVLMPKGLHVNGN